MSSLTNQPQIKSKRFIGTFVHEGLLLDVYGQFDGDGSFIPEAIGLAGTTVDISNLISDELDQVIVGWAEFMAPTWKAASREEQRVDDFIWAREMAVAF
jgi:hypothetical protein